MQLGRSETEYLPPVARWLPFLAAHDWKLSGRSGVCPIQIHELRRWRPNDSPKLDSEFGRISEVALN
jgi:hypothetical protein